MKIFMFLLPLILVTTRDSISSAFDINEAIEKLESNELKYAGKKTCAEDDIRLQLLAKSCIQTICGPESKMKTQVLSEDQFDEFDFSEVEKEWGNVKQDYARAYDRNIAYRKELLAEVIKKLKSGKLFVGRKAEVVLPKKLSYYDERKAKERVDELNKNISGKKAEVVKSATQEEINLAHERVSKLNEFTISPEEVSNLFFTLVVPNLNIVHNSDTAETTITLDDEANAKPYLKEASKLVIDWIKSRVGKDLVLRKKLNLPLTNKEMFTYIDSRLEKLEKDAKNLPSEKGFVSNQVLGFKNYYNNLKTNLQNAPIFGVKNLLKDFDGLEGNVGFHTRKDYTAKFKFCDNANCGEIFNNLKQDSLLKGFEDNLSFLDSQKKNKDKFINNCQSQYYLAHYNLTNQRATNMQAKVNKFYRVVSKYNKFIGKQLSKETSDQLAIKIGQSTDVILNGAKIQNRGNNYNSMFINLQRSMIDYANPNYVKMNTKSFTPFQLISSSLAPNDFLSMASMTCGGLDSSLHLADDSYSPFQNGMNISSFSTDNEKMGEGMISYQFGHVISSLLSQDAVSKKSRKKLIKARECINSRTLIPDYHSNTPLGVAKNMAFDHATSNEDFAEHLSNRSLSSITQSDIGEANSFYQCSYFPIKKGVLQNIALDFKIGTPHSSGFYRLINALLDRDIEIPENCRAVLANYSHRYSPKKCN